MYDPTTVSFSMRGRATWTCAIDGAGGDTGNGVTAGKESDGEDGERGAGPPWTRALRLRHRRYKNRRPKPRSARIRPRTIPTMAPTGRPCLGWETALGPPVGDVDDAPVPFTAVLRAAVRLISWGIQKWIDHARCRTQCRGRSEKRGGRQ